MCAAALDGFASLAMTKVNPLGLECLSVFGLQPALFIEIAGELGCSHVTLNLRGSANRLPQYPEVSLHDPAQRRSVRDALRAAGVRIGMLEGFVIAPGLEVDDLAGDLDLAVELGAQAICAVSMERDRPRSYAQFARLAELAAERGLVTTTEVGAGILRDLPRSLEAIAQVDHPAFALLIDTMHFFRSGSTVADLAALDPALIGHVQLADVPMPAQIESYMDEALHERRCPGDGDLPLAEFLAQVPEGVVVGLEIPIRSEAEAGIGPKERMARCVAAARRLMLNT